MLLKHPKPHDVSLTKRGNGEDNNLKSYEIKNTCDKQNYGEYQMLV